MITALFRNFLFAGALLATQAQASNTIKFINHCPYPAWFWIVGPEGSNLFGYDHQSTLIPPSGGSIIHRMHNTEALGGGMSLKLRDLPQYTVAPAGIMQVEYHLEPSRDSFWYDLSAIDCAKGASPFDPSFCPFVDGGVRLHVTPDGSGEGKGDICPEASCKNGMCVDTYMHEGSWLDEPSFDCRAGRDLLVEMCTENAGRQSQCDQAAYVESAPPPPRLEPSPDGLCGCKTGFTCKGSPWGECCSRGGICGSSPRSCGEGCQTSHGRCHGNEGRLPTEKEALSRQSTNVSPNGRCGAESGLTCTNSMFGSCCSSNNYCGNSEETCGAGCQSIFGDCLSPASRLRRRST